MMWKGSDVGRLTIGKIYFFLLNLKKYGVAIIDLVTFFFFFFFFDSLKHMIVYTLCQLCAEGIHWYYNKITSKFNTLRQLCAKAN